MDASPLASIACGTCDGITVLSHLKNDVRRLLYARVLFIVFLAGCLLQAALLDKTASTAVAIVFIIAFVVVTWSQIAFSPSSALKKDSKSESTVPSCGCSVEAVAACFTPAGCTVDAPPPGELLSEPLVLREDLDSGSGCLDFVASPPSSPHASACRLTKALSDGVTLQDLVDADTVTGLAPMPLQEFIQLVHDESLAQLCSPTTRRQSTPASPCWRQRCRLRPQPTSPCVVSAFASMDDSSGSGESDSDIASGPFEPHAPVPKRKGASNPQDDDELSISEDDDMAELYQRISPEDLADKLACKSVQVIDVRGRDFKGGHISECINMRTSSILDCPGAVVDLCRETHGIHQFVFTCMYSKIRAPRCATAVARHLRQQRVPGDQLQILVLQGGMQGWVNHWYKTQGWEDFIMKVPELDTEIWQFCENVGRAEGQLFTHGLVHSMDAVWSKGGKKELALALEDALHDRLQRIGHELQSLCPKELRPKDRRRARRCRT